MSQYREYQAPVVGQQGCSYSKLNQTYAGDNIALATVGQIAPMNVYVVPQLFPSGPGPNYPPALNTLAHGQDYLCGGYFNMKNAYQYASCESCNVNYVQRQCNGNL